MPYCKSCGAYIPDGQSKCLACGYDEEADRAAQQAAAAASAAAVSATNYSYVDPELKAYAIFVVGHPRMRFIRTVPRDERKIYYM